MRLFWPFLLGAALILVDCSAAARVPPTTVPSVSSRPTETTAAETRAGPAPSFVSIVGARPGQTADVTIQTQAGTACSIVYFNPAGKLGMEDGLNQDQVADATGRATWSWTIEPTTPTGKGSLRVRCNAADSTADIPIG